MNSYYVYMLASSKRGMLYTGFTSNLIKRVYEHKKGDIPGYTKRYKIDKLVYFEETSDVISAITREKRIKKWRRIWKIELIEKVNPEWRDLYYDII
jgi:putative endonuclease